MQEVFLFQRFHSFCRDGHAKRLAHYNNRLRDRAVALAGRDIANERSIDFQRVDREAFELAEIVYAIPCLAQSG